MTIAEYVCVGRADWPPYRYARANTPLPSFAGQGGSPAKLFIPHARLRHPHGTSKTWGSLPSLFDLHLPPAILDFYAPSTRITEEQLFPIKFLKRKAAIMVHLATVPNDSARSKPLVEGMKDMKIDSAEDDQTVSVYGSHFAACELPTHEMPDHEMPKEIAYRMIKDDLSLDGNPMLNLASFVTTYMVRSCCIETSKSRKQGC